MSNYEIPNYANIDIEQMAAKVGLKPKHIPILVGSFLEESQSILAELKKAIESMNFSDIEHHAHSIKGSSGNLKFDELYEMAREMEFAAKEQKSDYPYEEVCRVLQKGIASISL